MTTRPKREPRLHKSTGLQEAREKRDLAIYNEYNALSQIEGQSLTQINKYLMEKYDIHATGTIYVIRKRVEQRLNQKGVAR